MSPPLESFPKDITFPWFLYRVLCRVPAPPHTGLNHPTYLAPCSMPPGPRSAVPAAQAAAVVVAPAVMAAGGVGEAAAKAGASVGEAAHRAADTVTQGVTTTASAALGVAEKAAERTIQKRVAGALGAF